MSEKNFLDLKKYKKKKKIGQGGFGKVYIVKNKSTNKIYAAKVSIKKIDKKSPKDLLNISREVNIISKLNHPSILKFIGYSPVDFDKKSKPVIITEFSSNGSLGDILSMTKEKKKIDGWDDTKKLILIYGTANGMAYLHSHGIIHRDLKPDNIFLDNYLCPKIADFGLSKININDSSIDTLQSSKGELKGTPLYIAPEIWTKREYSPASDVYAFSLIMYEIFTGETPFKGYQFFRLMKDIGIDGVRPKLNDEIPESFKNLIESCWSQSPTERPTFDTIVEQLKTDPSFIFEGVDKDDYLSYVNFIEKSKISFDSKKKMISLSDIINQKSKAFKKVSISKNKVIKKQADKIIEKEKIVENIEPEKIKEDSESDHSNSLRFIDSSTFNNLNYTCQQLVLEAEEGNKECALSVAQGFIEGINDFPDEIEIGTKYLIEEISKENVQAMEYYGKLLIQGNILTKDEEKAVQVLTDAATKYNSSIAKYELAKNIMSHESFDVNDSNENINYVLAKQYSKEAADDGNIDAVLLYAKMSLKNIKNKFGELHIDPNESLKYYKIAADNGNPTGMALYGQFFESGRAGLKKDINEAIKFYKMSYEKGDMYGYALFGSALYEGKGNLQKNEEDGKKLIQLSFENNNTYGIECYAIYFISDNEEKVKYYKMSADLGSSLSFLNLGIFYRQGLGVDKNEELYFKYMEKAIENGSTSAALNLGLYYENNIKDIETAKKYYKYAADNGNNDSIYPYVQCIMDIKNKDEIIKYLDKGVEVNNIQCIMAYSQLYTENLIFPENPKEAARYIKIAADLGVKKAMVMYAHCLKNGWGVEKNESEALKYLMMGSDASQNECLIQ